ncbi:unnamed protein product [Ixodes pacificus]
MLAAELLQLHRLEEAAKCATLTNSEQVSPLKKKKKKKENASFGLESRGSPRWHCTLIQVHRKDVNKNNLSTLLKNSK